MEALLGFTKILAYTGLIYWNIYHDGYNYLACKRGLISGSYPLWYNAYTVCLTSRWSPVPRIKCWHFTFLQTTDMFTIVCFIGYVTYWHFNKHVISWSYYMSDCHVWSWKDSVGVGVDKAANICKCHTTCIPKKCFVLHGMSGLGCPAMFVESKTGILQQIPMFSVT